MTRFKKGTKVICTENATNQYTKGKIYEVKEYPGRHLLLDTTYDDKGSTTNGWNPEFFIPVSEIEPFAVRHNNSYELKELREYGRELGFREGYNFTNASPYYVYFNTKDCTPYYGTGSFSDIYYKTLTFEQFKNNEHIMNTKSTGTVTPNSCGVNSHGLVVLVVSPEFVKEAHKAACAVWKKKIEEQFPSLFPNVVFKVGEKVRIGCTEYIISCVDDNLYNLISLTDGNRFCDPFRVNNSRSITEKELKQNFMCGSEIVKI